MSANVINPQWTWTQVNNGEWTMSLSYLGHVSVEKELSGKYTVAYCNCVPLMDGKIREFEDLEVAKKFALYWAEKIINETLGKFHDKLYSGTTPA